MSHKIDHSKEEKWEHIGLLLARLNENFRFVGPRTDGNVCNKIGEVVVLIKIENSVGVRFGLATIDAVANSPSITAHMERYIVGVGEGDRSTFFGRQSRLELGPHAPIITIAKINFI